MSIKKSVRRLVRRLALHLVRRFGYEPVKLKAGASPNEIAVWSIMRCKLGQTSADFFVTHPLDSIQIFHFNGMFYEEEEIGIMNNFFNGGVFVDVGANVGNHTVYFASQANCTKVISFEPNPAIFPMLNSNVALNGLQQKVQTFNCGLSDSDDMLNMYSMDGHSSVTTMENLGKTNKNTIGIHDVSKFKKIGTGRVTTGDSILKGIQVDFIKVDVEGFELHCLNGLKGTISRCKPTIFVEVTEKTITEVLMLLREMGYDIRKTFSRYKGVENILLTPNRTEN